MFGIFSLQNVLLLNQYIDEKILYYIKNEQIDCFESPDHYCLLSFDWYDIHNDNIENNTIIIYFSETDLFFLYSSENLKSFLEKIFDEIFVEDMANEQILYKFFVRLLKDDLRFLEKFEEKINDDETEILLGSHKNFVRRVTIWKKQLLRLKHYYLQLDAILNEAGINDNGMISEEIKEKLAFLERRVDRFLDKVDNLQENVTQLREAYQSQLSIQQNELTKVFTVITTIFLPLTLLTGWYGMNFQEMPELYWKWSYPIVIVVAVGVVGSLLLIFKKKKWI